MGGADGSITISTDLDTSNVESSMKGLGSTIAKFAAAAIAAWGLFKAAVFATGSAIDEQMNTISARTGMAGDAVDELRQGFRDLSRDVGEGAFNMQEISESFAAVALYGHDATHALEIMSASMILAQATGEALGDAAYFLGNYLLKVGKDSSYAERYMNMFAHTVRNTNIPLNDLQNYMFRANAMIQAGGVASHQAAAAFGVMYTEGLRGAQMYSGMNTVIRDLITPSQRLTEIMNELGVAQFDITDSTRNAMDVMLELGDAVNAANDPLLRNALLLELGTDMGTQFMDAMFENVDAVRELSGELFLSKNGLEGLGVGFDMAATNGRTLINAFNRIRGATMAILDAFWMAKREVNINFFYSIADAIWSVADSNALATFIETFGRVTSFVFGGLITFIGQLGSAFTHLVTSINFSNLEQQFTPLFNMLRNLLGAVGDLIGAFARLTGAFLTFVSAGDNGFISGLIDSLVMLATFVIDMVINKINMLVFIVETLKTVFFGAGESSGQLGAMLTALLSVFQALFQVVIDVVVVIGSELNTAFSNFTSQMLNTESSGSAFSSFLSNLTNAFTSLANLVAVVGSILVSALAPAIQTVFVIIGMLVQIVGAVIGSLSTFLDIATVVASVVGAVLGFALERVAAIIRALAGSLDRLLVYFGAFLAVVAAVAGVVATVLTAAFVALTYILEGLAHVIEIVVAALAVMLYKKVKLKVIQTLTAILTAYNTKTLAMATSKKKLNKQLQAFAGYTAVQKSVLTKSNTQLTLQGALLTKLTGKQAVNTAAIQANMTAKTQLKNAQIAHTVAVNATTLAAAKYNTVMANTLTTEAQRYKAKKALLTAQFKERDALNAVTAATTKVGISYDKLIAKQKVLNANTLKLNKSLTGKNIVMAKQKTTTTMATAATGKFATAMTGLKLSFAKFAAPVVIAIAAIVAVKAAMSDMSDAMKAIVIGMATFVAVFAVMTKLKIKTLGLAGAFTALGAAKKGVGVAGIMSSFSNLGLVLVSAAKKVWGLAVQFKNLTLAMLANPIGLKVALVAGLVAGLAFLIIRLRGSSDAYLEFTNRMTEAREETAKFSESVQESATAFYEQSAAMRSSHTAANDLVSSVIELANTQNRSNAQAGEMMHQVNELNRRFPALRLSIDETTGALNMSAESMQLFVNEAIALETVETYYARLNEVIDQGNTYRERQSEALERLEELRQKDAEGAREQGMSQSELNDLIAQAEIDFAYYGERLIENALKYGYLSDALYEYMATLGYTQEQIEAYLEVRAREEHAISVLQEIYDHFGQQAKKVFTEVAESGEVSTNSIIDGFDRMITEMENQTQAWLNYAENMRTLEETAKRLEVEPEVVAELLRAVDGCKVTLQYLAQVADNEFMQIADVMERGAEASANYMIARYEAMGGDFERVMNDFGNIIESNTAIEDGLTNNINTAAAAAHRAIVTADFNGMATGAMDDFMIGSASQEGAMDAAGYSATGSYVSGCKSALEANSPSQVMIRMGEGSCTSFIQGVTSKLASLTATGKQAGQAFLQPLQALNLIPTGAAAIDGLIAGMNSRVGALTARANQIAATVQSSFQRALQVRSPSRLMRDTVGVHITDGITVGMYDRLAYAIRVCREIAGSIVENYIGAVSKGLEQDNKVAAALEKQNAVFREYAKNMQASTYIGSLFGEGIGNGILDEIAYVKNCARILVEECMYILYTLPEKTLGLSTGIADSITKGIPTIKNAVQSIRILMEDIDFSSLADLQRHMDELPDILVKFDVLTVQIEDKLGVRRSTSQSTMSGDGEQTIDLDVNIYYNRDEDPDIYDQDAGRRIGQDFQRELRGKGLVFLPT